MDWICNITIYSVNQANPWLCRATLVLYLVAGDPGEDRQEPDISIGMTLLDRLEQDDVFQDFSTVSRLDGCFSLVKMSCPDIFLSLWLPFTCGISLEEVKQMSPTLWNFYWRKMSQTQLPRRSSCQT